MQFICPLIKIFAAYKTESQHYRKANAPPVLGSALFNYLCVSYFCVKITIRFQSFTL